MPELLTTAALAAALGTRTFEEFASSLNKSFLSGIAEAMAKQYERLTLNFQPHLKATYERCTKIKTILKKDEPIDLVSHYVDLDFVCGGNKYSNGAAIEDMCRRRKVIIFGTAGTGKTVFMRYLWLSLFYAHDGRIPVFVELRKLNDLTTPNLRAYIHSMFVGAGSEVAPEIFDELVRKGKFVFMLDGFDEVSNDKKTAIEKQILDIANACPNLLVVVSSRPNERLKAWQLFSVFQVKRLEKNQVIDLITKINYEPEAKAKFLKRIDKDLYERHSSFLSSPLLATMMLMTFSQFVDIPQKVYLFYQQAFETLFLRHDASKEAFQRQMYTNLSMHEFSVCLSYFCLVTYLDQKFEFSVDEVRSYLSKAFSIEGSRADVDEFLKDLLESVCILQQEGLQCVFSHRSFQEYFTALAISRLPAGHAGRVLEHIAARNGDDVVPMLFDMNQELVEQEFVVPLLERLVPPLKDLAIPNSLGGFLEMFEIDIRFVRGGKESFFCVFQNSGEDHHRLHVLLALYPSRRDNSAKRDIEYDKLDSDVIRRFFREDKLGGARANVESILLKHENVSGTYIYKRSKFTRSIKSEEQADTLVDPVELNNLGVVRYIHDFVDTVVKLQGFVLRSRRKKENTLDQVLFPLPAERRG